MKKKITVKKTVQAMQPPELKKIIGVVTGVDTFYDLLKKKGKVSGREAAKACGVSVSVIEEWANSLQDSDLVSVSYSILGEIVISLRVGDKK
ncbi:MAG: hypothetical protein ABH803_00060 [Candidatus Micrarchaeota archaeon]